MSRKQLGVSTSKGFHETKEKLLWEGSLSISAGTEVEITLNEPISDTDLLKCVFNPCRRGTRVCECKLDGHRYPHHTEGGTSYTWYSNDMWYEGSNNFTLRMSPGIIPGSIINILSTGENSIIYAIYKVIE